MREFYSTLDVSGICGVDPVTVARWCDKKDLVCYKTPGGHRRIRTQDLVDFLTRHGMDIPEQLVRPSVRVLAVVSDARLLAALKKRYANHGGAVQLVTAQNLIEGLISFGANAPAAVVLDLDVPGGDPLAVCRQLRSVNGARVVALGDAARARHALKAGAEAALPKPVDLKALDQLLLPKTAAKS